MGTIRLAQPFAALIIQAEQQQESDQNEPENKEVDLDSLEVIRPRSVGKEHVALEALRSLKLDEKLKATPYVLLLYTHRFCRRANFTVKIPRDLVKARADFLVWGWLEKIWSSHAGLICILRQDK